MVVGETMALTSAALAAVPLYGQCGGVGGTACAIGICSIQDGNIPGQATNPPASTISSMCTAANPVGTTLPSSFTWSLSGILISPKVGSCNLSIGSGYCTTPQNKWYLIFQNGNTRLLMNSEISSLNGWTPPKNFYSGTCSIITNNIGSRFWVDMWVIYNNGHLYHSQTLASDFLMGMSKPVIALQDLNNHNLFKASNIYKVGDEFLLVIACIGSNGRCYFHSWSGTNLGVSQTNPFASTANVALSGFKV
ncbi:hypothetical protein BDN71DRAFT_1482384 [Pleurotus eryngii]|uniref:Alpha-L-arabinofuranosidase n=1 Tax=Pleurotus eryngii TaxID=5323 RepID=A0A9P6A2E4_PLEER|nr:hypothetical protein BDN71DRAFT_1482384 [Pleurotus eryngii]